MQILSRCQQRAQHWSSTDLVGKAETLGLGSMGACLIAEVSDLAALAVSHLRIQLRGLQISRKVKFKGRVLSFVMQHVNPFGSKGVSLAKCEIYPCLRTGTWQCGMDTCGSRFAIGNCLQSRIRSTKSAKQKQLFLRNVFVLITKGKLRRGSLGDSCLLRWDNMPGITDSSSLGLFAKPTNISITHQWCVTTCACSSLPLAMSKALLFGAPAVGVDVGYHHQCPKLPIPSFQERLPTQNWFSESSTNFLYPPLPEISFQN